MVWKVSSELILNFPPKFCTCRALTCEEFKTEYAVDEVHWVRDMATVLSEKGVTRVHTLVRFSSTFSHFPPKMSLLVQEGLNSDSKEMYEPAEFVGKDKLAEDKTVLFNVTAELRVHKTDEELKVRRRILGMSNLGKVQPRLLP